MPTSNERRSRVTKKRKSPPKRQSGTERNEGRAQGRRKGQRKGRSAILALWLAGEDLEVPLFMGGLAVAGALLAAAVYVPAVAHVLGVGMLCLAPWLVCLAALRGLRMASRGVRRLSLAIAIAASLVTTAVMGEAVFPGAPLATTSLSEATPTATLDGVPDGPLTLSVAGDLADEPAPTLRVSRAGASKDIALIARAAPPEEEEGFLEAASGRIPLGQRVDDVRLPGSGATTLELVGEGSAGARVDVALRETSMLMLAAPWGLGAIALAALALQIGAARQRRESWLFVGVLVAAVLGVYGATAFDANAPAKSAIGILLVALLGGGVAGVTLSYLIARFFEPALPSAVGKRSLSVP